MIVPNDPPNFTKCIAQVAEADPVADEDAAKTLKTDCKQLFTSLSSQVMDFLIRAYWYQADAAQAGHQGHRRAGPEGVHTPPRSSSSRPTAQFQAFLSSSGQTLDDILYRVRVNQIYTKLLAQHRTTVTAAEIPTYYNAHTSQFGTPETRNIRIVLTKTQAEAQAAKAALETGKSWEAVAKKYSIDPTTKNNGGLLDDVTKGQQDAALDNAAFAAPPNKLHRPDQGPVRLLRVRGDQDHPGHQQTLAQATRMITADAHQQAQTSAQNAVDDAGQEELAAPRPRAASMYAMADCTATRRPRRQPRRTTTAAPRRDRA